MPERIYTLTKGDALHALEESAFATEDELQALIAEHLELLDGEQIGPGDARRCVLIKREKGIAAAVGGGSLPVSCRSSNRRSGRCADPRRGQARIDPGNETEIRRTDVEVRGARRRDLNRDSSVMLLPFALVFAIRS